MDKISRWKLDPIETALCNVFLDEKFQRYKGERQGGFVKPTWSDDVGRGDLQTFGEPDRLSALPPKADTGSQRH